MTISHSKNLQVFLFVSLVLNAICLFYFGNKIYTKYISNKAPDTNMLELVPFDKVEKYFEDQEKYFDRFPIREGNTVFIGNSLTQEFNVSEFFDNIRNRGINGDHSGNLLQRLEKILRNNPKKIFIEVGVNDILYWKFGTDSLMQNFRRIATMLGKRRGTTQAYIQSILPVVERNTKIPSYSFKNKDILSVNQQLKLLCHRDSIKYIDLYKAFVAEGEMDSKYTTDGVHLNNSGYQLWSQIIKPYVDE